MRIRDLPSTIAAGLVLGLVVAGQVLFGAGAALAQTSWAQPGPATGTGYPLGAEPFVAVATAAATSATVTIPARQGKTIFVCNVYMAEAAGTADAANGTMTNMLGVAASQTAAPAATTVNFLYTGVAFAATANAQILQPYWPCMAAFSQNLAVVVTTPVSTAASLSDVQVLGYYF